MQYNVIFFNLYIVCFSLLLALQNLSENTDTSDHFYVARKISEGNYYEECYVVSKSVIINSGIFQQIPGVNCTITGSTMTITSDQGNSQITFTGYAAGNPSTKPIYLMSKSFIDNIIRSSTTDYFAMDEITIGSLFAQLQLKQYSASSLNFMLIKNEDDEGLARFFLSIESNNNNLNYSYITWFKPGTYVLKFYFL